MEWVDVSASVRTVVEFAHLSGSLLPGMQLSRMREGMFGHKARQAAVPEGQAEAFVKGAVLGETVRLTISGRIDLLYERDGIPVIEEIKLAPYGDPPASAVPVHRAQAVCYAHLYGGGLSIVRILYVRQDGAEVASFEETITEDMQRDEFEALVAPYLRKVEERARWCALRDASIGALPFPFGGYRRGQREMAVQVYLAIRKKRRLFAEAPTGTGKTAAALFPALKALGEGLTGQIFYLTARTTGQENATAAIKRMRDGGLRLRALTLVAKEKLCGGAHDPAASEGAASAFRCDMLACPRAIGFFDRLPAALDEMRERDDWQREAVEAVAEAHQVCPFEFSLTLCEEADAVVCDYNYAFDPGARIRRVFQWNTNLTLLVDEAHNLPDRARAMLSAPLSSASLRETRRAAGKRLGRRDALYTSLTALIRFLEARPDGADPVAPEALLPLLSDTMDAALGAMHALPLSDLSRALIAALGALSRFDARYISLTQSEGRHKTLTLFCLDPAPYLTAATKKLRGSVFFSATLTPLSAWRDTIGGDGEDGLVSLLSPFPQENLLVLRHPLPTRYRLREQTAPAVAEAILAAVLARPGNYLACFPSYAYLHRVCEEIEARNAPLSLHIQRSRMTEAERTEYLAAFLPRTEGALLGMIVMGGVFGEGVDLPGERLSGVVIVGAALPQICDERELLREYYTQSLGDGFAYAYRIPGMNKVLQAVGRVIRTETDRGVALLIDDRFLSPSYAALMPVWWGEAQVVASPDAIVERIRFFWQGKEK